MAKIKTGIYRGIKFREQRFQGMPIIEGYDQGWRVIYACSKKEFKSKVAAYLKTGATNQATPWNRPKGGYR